MSTHYFRFNAHAAQRQRSGLLERLLARADERAVLTDWRAEAFRAIAPLQSMPPPAAVALRAECGTVQGAWVYIATPLHYVAEMSNVLLPPDGILSLDQAEAVALAADFNRVWHDAGVRMLLGRYADLFCVADQPLAAMTRDPEQVRGRHIDGYLPSGAAAPRLRQLMSEIEMWLFDHPVNRLRNGGAAPAVSGLWLWGAGAPLELLPPVQGWAEGDDVFFRAFSMRAAARDAGMGAMTPAVVVSTEEPGTAAWLQTQSRLEASVAELRSGRIEQLLLSAGDRCFAVSARSSWRFWRRSRPWWEFFV